MKKKIGLSRRMFLRGAGGAALCIPFLPSLLPRGASAQSANKPCFVGLASIYGAFTNNWEVNMQGQTQIAPNVQRATLSGITGPMSRTLDSKFDPFRSKMAVFQGLDGTSTGGHNYCYPFSGATHQGGSDALDTPPHHPYSLDTVLERANGFYGDSLPPVPVLRSAPQPHGESTNGISWWTDGAGNSTSVPYEGNSETLFSTIFSVIPDPGEPMPTVNPNAQKIRVMDRVLEDYRRLENNGRLGLDDKRRLQHYADLVQGLSTRLNRTSAPPGMGMACVPPMQRAVNLVPQSEMYSNHIDIMVAALACGITRIGMMWIPDHDDANSSQSIYHGWSHGSDTSGGASDVEAETQMLEANMWVGSRITEVLTKMDAVTMTDGSTLLDQSAVMWSNELGNAQWHTNIATPVVVAGSAGGRLRTDVAYDYRLSPTRLWASRTDFPPLGRPYGQMLSTLLTAMGVERSEWLKQGSGFGDFQAFDNQYTDGAYEEFRGQESQTLPDYFMG